MGDTLGDETALLEPLPPPVDAPVASTVRQAGWLAWTAAIGIVLLVVVRSPTENLPVWTPKVAVALVLTGLAIPQIFLLLRSPGPLRRTTVAGGIFLVAVGLAALLSPLTGIAFLGQYGVSSGVGWVFYLCLVAFWSLGATIGAEGAGLVHDAIVVACILDAVASVLSLFTEHQSFFADALTHVPGLFTDEGQSLGLMDNPVFSGALLAGGAALLITTDRYRQRVRLELLAVVAVGLELSGSRFGLLVVVAVLAAAAVTKGVRAAARSGLAVVAGIAIGYLLNRLFGGVDVSSRISSAGGGSTYSARLTEWIDALRVTAHHPVLGVGPGQATSAISPLWSSSFAHESAPLGDSHNLFVEVLVTTGIIGLACLLLWLVPVLRHAHGPLLACGIGMLAIELVEPLYVGITPIAFLTLGAAVHRLPPLAAQDTSDVEASDGPSGSAAEDTPGVEGADGPSHSTSTRAASPTDDIPRRADRLTRTLRIVTTGVAVAAASVLLIGDAYYHQGVTGSTDQVGQFETAIRLLPPWPDLPTDLASTISSPTEIAQSGNAVTAKQNAVTWAARAVARDPRNFRTLTSLALAQQSAGDLGGARRTFQAALARFPWNAQALSGLASLDLQEGDATSALPLYQKALLVSGIAADQYQVRCLTHVIPRHLTTSEILTLCPARPPLLALLGVEPPGWVATPSTQGGNLNFGHIKTK